MNTCEDFVLFSECNSERTAKDIKEDTVAGNPEQGVWMNIIDRSGAFKSGVWECTAGTFRATMEDQVEFCQIIEGEAEITCVEDGSKRTVSAGSAFVMENGLTTEWHVPNYVKKHFVICQV